MQGGASDWLKGGKKASAKLSRVVRQGAARPSNQWKCRKEDWGAQHVIDDADSLIDLLSADGTSLDKVVFHPRRFEHWDTAVNFLVGLKAPNVTLVTAGHAGFEPWWNLLEKCLKQQPDRRNVPGQDRTKAVLCSRKLCCSACPRPSWCCAQWWEKNKQS